MSWKQPQQPCEGDGQATDTEASLEEVLRQCEEQKRIKKNLELQVARKLREMQGLHQDHYNYVLLDRDDYGCDKFFAGTRGLPDDWAAYVFFNRNTVNIPREFPAGEFILRSTLVGGRTKPGSVSNAYLSMHYVAGKLAKGLLAPEETYFWTVCGPADRYKELQAQLQKLECHADGFDGKSQDFGALLRANFIDTKPYYWDSNQVFRGRSQAPQRGKGQRRAASARW